MTLNELAELGSSRNFRVVGDKILGVYSGYPFTLNIRQVRGMDTLVFSFSVDKAITGKTRKEIKNGLPSGATVTIATAGQLDVACKSENDTEVFGLVIKILDMVTDTLRNASKLVSAPERCGMCNKKECDSFAMVGAKFTSVHRECVTNKSMKVAEDARQNKRGGNYLLGIVGAIIGALVGCIPTILTVVLMKMEYGILYFLIPLASYQGYKIFKGKMGGVARVVVIAASVLAFIFMQPIIYHILWTMDGYNKSIWYDIIYYFAYIPLPTFFEESWFGILFLIIGIVSSFKALGVSNDDILQTAAVNMDSLTNTDGSYSAASQSWMYESSGVELEY